MPLQVDVTLTLNGRETTVAVPVGASALTILREHLDLAGAKLACGEGECGACTIIVDGQSLNSCLMPAVDLAGRKVVTIEGLWTADGIDPVQEAFIEHGAVQCGFCTPGMIMQIRYLLDKNPEMTDKEIRRGLEGNVCRCTGYQKIIDAVIVAGRSAAA